MNEPRWLLRHEIDYLHALLLRRFGGSQGVRDDGSIESALARPINKYMYAQVDDIAELAAAYGYGLAQNHGYVDGNKRVGFAALGTFLRLNRYLLNADEAEATAVMLAVASGTLSESELASWVREHLAPLEAR